MGLEKLFDFLFEFLEDFLPFFVVKEFQKAAVLRRGIFHRVCEKGIWFKIPFLDQPLIYMVVTTTMETPVQTLITADDKEVSIQAIVKYNISDVVLHTTAIYDAVDALSDLTQGHLMREINKLTYMEARDTDELGNSVTKKVRQEVKRYGVYIEQVTLTNFVRTRNYRLFSDSPVD